MATDNERWLESKFQKLQPNAEWQPDVNRGLKLFHGHQSARRIRRPNFTWVLVGVVAAGASVMAFPATRAFAQRCASACVSGTEAVRAFIFGTAPAEPLGLIAPDFILTDADGKALSLSDLRGRAVLLNFWATWCAPCGVEIPWFIELQRQHPGLTVVGVSMDEEGWAVVRPYIEAKGINYRIAIGTENLARAYEAGALPTTLLIDQEGRIVERFQGLVERDEYSRRVQLLLRK